MTSPTRRTRILAIAAVFAASAAIAACSSSGPEVSSTGTPPAVTADDASFAPIVGTTWASTAEGVQHLHFSYGPITIEPGQNNIAISDAEVPKPDQNGWIVGIQPNIRRPDGTVPPVDVIHLHHGVWLNLGAADPTSSRLPERFMAAGEEKTSMELPQGYGYRYDTSDVWMINYMIHNLLATPDQISITYDIDFIPEGSPLAQGIKDARPIWMDVQNGSAYPVFDVAKGSGTDGTFTYPDDATDPYHGKRAKNQWKVDRDSVLLATAAHLHPGGLYGDMDLTRDGQSTRLFRSEAVYYEPAGAVSWDVSMTATPPDWRPTAKAGDTLSISATYDTTRASWYESMGIMVLWVADAEPGVGVDPFQQSVDVKGELTHGHLPENDNHGGADDPERKNTLQLPSGPAADTVDIAGFGYAPGDMSVYDSVPVVKKGGTLHFVNHDAPLANGIWHTITACKAPCNQSTGVAYPLADGDVQFDSGQLGLGGAPTANRTDWNLPSDLPTGTYTYFCRVHPSMRGAFRVEDG